MSTHSTNLNDASESAMHAIDYWQVFRTRWGVILLTSLLVLITAVVITHIIPKKYKSSSIIEIKYPQQFNPLPGVGNEALNGATVSRYWIETQIRLVKSERTLKEVVKNLGLQSEWNVDEDTAVNIIKSVATVTPELGTDLVKIEVQHKDRDETVALARSIAESYKKQRLEEEAKRIDEDLYALDKILQEQQNDVEDKRTALNNQIRAAGVTIHSVGQDGTLGVDASRQHAIASDQLKELEDQKETIINQITQLSGKSDEQLISVAAGLDLPNSSISTMHQQYLVSDRELLGLKEQGMGPNHPRMVAAVKTHNQLLSDLYNAVKDLRKTLDVQLQVITGKIEAKRVVVDQEKEKAIGASVSSTEYKEAKKAFDDANKLLQDMKMEKLTQIHKIKTPKITMEIHEEAKKPGRHSFPNEKLNYILGGVLGLILGIGLAFFLEFVDSSIKSLDDVERYLQVPVLAVIPKDIELLHKVGGNTPDAEAYRILRTNIEFNKRRSPGDNCITVVSGGAGEGKSTTLINLAYVCAQGGYSTLIIDADLRRPRLHTYFDINNSIGLSNYLTSDLKLEDVILQTPTENLYFMSSGVIQADPSGILNSNRMSGLISEVKDRFDLVFIDSPPILGVSDASVISSECDQTMIVIQHRKLPRNILMRVKQSIEAVGGNILGVVLNNVDIRSDSQYQYYTSYYTYYSAEDTSVTEITKAYDEKTPRKSLTMNKATAQESNSKDSSIY